MSQDTQAIGMDLSFEEKVPPSAPRPKLFIAVEARRNQPLGTLIRCATAFGISSLIVVGSKHFSTHGSHGSHRRMGVLHFFYWSDCIAYLRETYPSIQFGGITSSSDPIGNGSIPAISTDRIIYTTDYVCLVTQSDVRLNLTPEQIAFLDFSLYVRVPHKVLEPHLHWMTKLSIVFRTFGEQKGFSTTSHEGQKFSVVGLQEGSTASIKTFSSTANLQPTIEDQNLTQDDVNNENENGEDIYCMNDLFCN